MMWLRECINETHQAKDFHSNKPNQILYNYSTSMLISGFLNYTLGGVSPVGVDMIEKPTHKKANPTTIFTTNNY